jgi:outer membrane immunogenic protein
MKKVLLLASFTLSLLLPVGTAIAADMDEPLPPPPPPVTELRPASYDWSGAYAGVWGGLTCIDGTASVTQAGPPVTTASFLNAGCGAKGGLVAGYNYQMDDIVMGVEADWGMTGNVVHNTQVGADFDYGMDHIATARARLGYAMDDTMFFVTGGAAWAKGHLIDNVSTATPTDLTAEHWGWTVGGGVEHAVTDQLRVRMDYLYTHFDQAKYSAACCNVDAGPGDDHEVRVAAIWSF